MQCPPRSKICGAKTRSGHSCRSSPVRGKSRCRMHGGAAGSGAPPGPANGNWKHGLFTKEAVAVRRELAGFLKASRTMLREVLRQ